MWICPLNRLFTRKRWNYPNKEKDLQFIIEKEEEEEREKDDEEEEKNNNLANLFNQKECVFILKLLSFLLHLLNFSLSKFIIIIII